MSRTPSGSLSDFSTDRRVLLVDEHDRLKGIVTRGDVMRSLEVSESRAVTALDAGTADPVVAHPEETLHDALARMLRHDIGRLPVVDPRDPGRIVGYLGRAAVLAARLRNHEEEHIRE